MYELEVVTKYNKINLIVDDYNSPEVQEILSQPYIISCRLKEIKDVKQAKGKRLIKTNDNEE